MTPLDAQDIYDLPPAAVDDIGEHAEEGNRSITGWCPTCKTRAVLGPRRQCMFCSAELEDLPEPDRPPAEIPQVEPPALDATPDKAAQPQPPSRRPWLRVVPDPAKASPPDPQGADTATPPQDGPDTPRPVGGDPSPVQPERHSTSRGEPSTPFTDDELISVIQAHGQDGVTPKVLAGRFGVGRQAIRSRLAVLVREGHVQAAGATTNRRYRATPPVHPPGERADPKRDTDPASRRGPYVHVTLDETLAAVARHGRPASASEVRETLGAGKATVCRKLTALVNAGRLVTVGDGNRVRYTLADVPIPAADAPRQVASERPESPVEGRVLALLREQPLSYNAIRVRLALGKPGLDRALSALGARGLVRHAGYNAKDWPGAIPHAGRPSPVWEACDPGSPSTGDERSTGRERLLLATLKRFGVNAEIIGTAVGPHVTRFELEPAPGTKMSAITRLKDDLAYALAAPHIRILAPIPGRRAVGVEIPNRERQTVRLEDMPTRPEGASPLTVWLGKDLAGDAVGVDLATTPHVLVAGTTGAGKSVALNAMLSAILRHATPAEVRLMLVDTKQVELNHYEGVPHLIEPPIGDADRATRALEELGDEMDRRYGIMSEHRVRSLPELNQALLDSGKTPLPYILVAVDEFADLMMASAAKVEDAIKRLAQKARAVGIHLVLATQSPRVDVITGTIKANVPSRLALAVASQVDSRVVLDETGAEDLLGAGDMLFKPVGSGRLQRIQGTFIDTDEIAGIVAACQRHDDPDPIPAFHRDDPDPDEPWAPDVLDCDEDWEMPAPERPQPQITPVERAADLTPGMVRAALAKYGPEGVSLPTLARHLGVQAGTVKKRIKQLPAGEICSCGSTSDRRYFIAAATNATEEAEASAPPAAAAPCVECQQEPGITAAREMLSPDPQLLAAVACAGVDLTDEQIAGEVLLGRYMRALLVLIEQGNADPALLDRFERLSGLAPGGPLARALSAAARLPAGR